MKHTVLLTVVTLFLTDGVVAQNASTLPNTPQKEEKEKRSLKDRFWFGGGVGLNFGAITAIQVSPIVGYFLEPKKKVSVGAGINYTYYHDNRYAQGSNNNLYGYRLFTRYRPIQQFFVHAEFLHMNAQRYGFNDNILRRMWIPHLLLGGGYVQSLGGRNSIYFQVLFDVLQDPNSLYSNQPILGGGVGIGF